MHKNLIPFLRELDKGVLECGGRLYCAKDVCTLPETFAAMYPRLDEFRGIKARLDPDTLFSSTMARRLGIVGGQGGPAHG
jgi:FAD/FMN-containing dehydrogenase